MITIANIVLNEYKLAKEILKNGEIGQKPVATLSLLARLCVEYEKKESEIYDLLNKFMENYYPNYNAVKWRETLESVVKEAHKRPLTRIDKIGITQSELDIIEGLQNIRLERLAFTLLVCAKYSNARSTTNDNWVNIPDKDIFKMARVPMTVVQQCELMHDLKTFGLISFSKKVDNLNTRVNFVDSNTDYVLEIFDLREIGYEYLKYKGEKFIRCEKCGILVKPKNNRTKYCRNCADIIEKERIHKKQ